MSFHFDDDWAGMNIGAHPLPDFARTTYGGDEMELDSTLHLRRAMARTREMNENLDKTSHLRTIKKQRVVGAFPTDIPRLYMGSKPTVAASAQTSTAGTVGCTHYCLSFPPVARGVQQSIVSAEQAALSNVTAQQNYTSLHPKATSPHYLANNKQPPTDSSFTMMLWVCDSCGKTELDLSSSRYRCFKCNHEEKSLLLVDRRAFGLA
mmetsp:Transcript_17230/g.50003  ORF Transcript_17230/g.50003 Transcript_17230/m.50003 type:complete len:207 (-) Transcript_17230:2471-3091(-)